MVALGQELPHTFAQICKVYGVFMEQRVPRLPLNRSVARPTASPSSVLPVNSPVPLVLRGGSRGHCQHRGYLVNNWLKQRGTLTNVDEARALAQARLFLSAMTCLQASEIQCVLGTVGCDLRAVAKLEWITYLYYIL